MSMDKRIETKTQPMYGCHSDLDRYRITTWVTKCNFDTKQEERACEGCKRREGWDE